MLGRTNHDERKARISVNQCSPPAIVEVKKRKGAYEHTYDGVGQGPKRDGLVPVYSFPPFFSSFLTPDYFNARSSCTAIEKSPHLLITSCTHPSAIYRAKGMLHIYRAGLRSDIMCSAASSFIVRPGPAAPCTHTMRWRPRRRRCGPAAHVRIR